jgi:predicted TIM-barrel fold metal-dependent hydrolase
MARARVAWHELTREAPLAPDLPICDAHHHLWHGGEPPPRNRDRYLLDELLADMGSGHRIVSTVFVEARAMYRCDGPEAMRPIGETEFVNGIAAMSASGLFGPARVAAGIVGFADLRLGAAVTPVLEAHVQASSRFRGVRYATSWNEHPVETQISQPAPRGLLLDAAFRDGLACLARLGLSFDAWMTFTQLPELATLARGMPDLRIVLGHVGGLIGIGPYRARDEVFATWRRNISEVARCPNVAIKIGGIGIDRHGFGWSQRPRPPSSTQMAQAFAPYVLHCIEAFGPSRCMFESNFPVDGQSASYPLIWNAFKRITEGFGDTERRALFHDTAAAVYRLPNLA